MKNNMIEIRCPYCDTLQKVRCELFETQCKKCANTINVEESLELFLRGGAGGARPVDNDLPLEELIDKGQACMAADDYGRAQDFLRKAADKEPERSDVNWLFLRAKLCVEEPDDELKSYVDPVMRAQTIAQVAARSQTTEKMAQYNLETRARTFARYTDEETDDAVAAAAAQAEKEGETDKAREMRRAYAVYAYEEVREEAVEGQSNLNILSEILPNFSKRKGIIEWKTVAVFVCGLLALVGGITMILLEIATGWSIALTVIGFLIALIGAVAILVDGKRRDVCRFVLNFEPKKLDEIIAYTMPMPPEGDALQEARYTTLVTLYGLIKNGQLTHIGVRDAQSLVYYNEDGSELTENGETKAQEEPFEENVPEE